MGQQSNSGRHAQLDEKKERAAGRQKEHGRSAPNRGSPQRKTIGGAFGADGRQPASRKRP